MLNLGFVTIDNAIENAILKVFRIQLSMKINNFSCFFTCEYIKKSLLATIFLSIYCLPIALLKIVDAPLECLYFLGTLNLLYFINLT